MSQVVSQAKLTPLDRHSGFMGALQTHSFDDASRSCIPEFDTTAYDAKSTFARQCMAARCVLGMLTEMRNSHRCGVFADEGEPKVRFDTVFLMREENSVRAMGCSTTKAADAV